MLLSPLPPLEFLFPLDTRPGVHCTRWPCRTTSLPDAARRGQASRIGRAGSCFPGGGGGGAVAALARSLEPGGWAVGDVAEAPGPDSVRHQAELSGPRTQPWSPANLGSNACSAAGFCDVGEATPLNVSLSLTSVQTCQEREVPRVQ